MSRQIEAMQLSTIELFCRAAELNSFTATAEALGINQASVSRAIARLETRLGVKLLQRNTRSMRLTEAGSQYRAQCQQALEQIKEAERVITGDQAQPQGSLRISVPTTYAHYRLLPHLPEFSARYPKIAIELHISNRNIDFFEEGFDLAIRMGTPKDSRLIARPLENATLGVFAAPAYLKLRSRPKRLADLQSHPCIAFVLPSTGKVLPWLFFQDGKEIDISVDASLKVIDDVLGTINWAAAGGGLCQIYHFIADAFVARGELVEVLKPFAGRSRAFQVLYPQNRFLSAKVRAFLQFLQAAKLAH
jgi:DNA-binding transcriptional LysR family regulator